MSKANEDSKGNGDSKGGEPTRVKFCKLESSQSFDIVFWFLKKTNLKDCDSEN